MTSAPSSSADPMPSFAGVYVAKSPQLLIGPLAHLRQFLTASTGSAFASGNAPLPPPSLRYIVDCAPHLSDLPPLPDYAMVPPSSPSVESRDEHTGVSREAAADPSPAGVCPATMSPFSSTAADEERHTEGVGGVVATPTPTFTPPASPLSRSSTAAATAAAAAPTSTSEVVRRMNRSAEECLARLRQRCVQNGMSTAVFASVRLTSASPLAQSSSSPPLPTTEAPAAPHSLQSFAATTGAATATRTITTHADPTKKAENRTNISALPRANTELFQHAKLNDELCVMAGEKLGAGHVLHCPIPNTDDSLGSAVVQETVQRIHHILESNAEAQVYVYSLDGKGTASSLAVLYLLQVDHIALQEALLQRLPVCTPRMSCLAQLIERDPHPDKFDRLAYLRLYLARRYPSASASSIEAALSTCNGNYAKAERLVRLELSFKRVDDPFLPSRESRRSGSVAASNCNNSNNGFQLLSNMSSFHYNNNTSTTTQTNSPVAGAASSVNGGGVKRGDVSLSDFSLCSSFVKDPMVMTEGDEKIIDSLYHALANSHLGVSRDEVRESYVQHHRAQDLVLRHFLLRFRLNDHHATPPRIHPFRSTSGHYNGGSSRCATPTTEPMDQIALPRFVGQSASRRGSMAPDASSGATKMPTDSCTSPEPTAPPVHAASTPKWAFVKTPKMSPSSGQQTAPTSAVRQSTTPRTAATDSLSFSLTNMDGTPTAGNRKASSSLTTPRPALASPLPLTAAVATAAARTPSKSTAETSPQSDAATTPRATRRKALLATPRTAAKLAKTPAKEPHAPKSSKTGRKAEEGFAKKLL